MRQAQWIFRDGTTTDALWEQMEHVETALNNAGMLLGPGAYNESADGVKRTVLVDCRPELKRAEAAMLQVTENPTLGCSYLHVRCEGLDDFDHLLDAVILHVDREPLADLARNLTESPTNNAALTKLGISLVGKRFDRASYDALSSVLAGDDALAHCRVASVVGQLGWRSMLRPLHARLAASLPPEGAILQTFDTLQWHDERQRQLFPADTKMTDITGALDEALSRHASLKIHSQDNVRWIAGTQTGQIDVAAWEIGDICALECRDDSWLNWAKDALHPLQTASPQSLRDDATGGEPHALLRLVTADKRFDVTIDDLLQTTLCSSQPDLRAGAIMAIGSGVWESAIPDLEDALQRESVADNRELLLTVLQQFRGY